MASKKPVTKKQKKDWGKQVEAYIKDVRSWKNNFIASDDPVPPGGPKPPKFP